ncbi:MAG: hypothetical protein KA186_03990 [Flavobacteriales bacterium]|nr:hypothetical protein [Flavobacteriales bacterium]
MAPKLRNREIREIILTILGLIYLINSFKIGFWLSRDMHSGGSIVGVLLFPLFLAFLLLLLFYNDPKRRTYASAIIGLYVLIALLLWIVL